MIKVNECQSREWWLQQRQAHQWSDLIARIRFIYMQLPLKSVLID